jgi:hypothetical protein
VGRGGIVEVIIPFPVGSLLLEGVTQGATGVMDSSSGAHIVIIVGGRKNDMQ